MMSWRDDMEEALPGARERSSPKIEAQAREMVAEALNAIIVKYEAGNNHDSRHFNPDCQTCLILNDLRALSLPSVEIRREACTCGELKPGQGHRDRCPTLTSLVDANGKPKIAPVQGYVAGIPWSLQLRAYDAYCKKWGHQAAMIDLDRRGCRGGFSVGELDDFVPGWRDEVSEITRLNAEVEDLKRNEIITADSRAHYAARAEQAEANTARLNAIIDEMVEAGRPIALAPVGSGREPPEPQPDDDTQVAYIAGVTFGDFRKFRALILKARGKDSNVG